MLDNYIKSSKKKGTISGLNPSLGSKKMFGVARVVRGMGLGRGALIH